MQQVQEYGTSVDTWALAFVILIPMTATMSQESGWTALPFLFYISGTVTCFLLLEYQSKLGEAILILDDQNSFSESQLNKATNCNEWRERYESFGSKYDKYDVLAMREPRMDLADRMRSI